MMRVPLSSLVRGGSRSTELGESASGPPFTPKELRIAVGQLAAKMVSGPDCVPNEILVELYKCEEGRLLILDKFKKCLERVILEACQAGSDI